MYHKILVPLDGSKEAEKVVSLIKDELSPDGIIALLKVFRRPRLSIWEVTPS